MSIHLRIGYRSSFFQFIIEKAGFSFSGEQIKELVSTRVWNFILDLLLLDSCPKVSKAYTKLLSELLGSMSWADKLNLALQSYININNSIFGGIYATLHLSKIFVISLDPIIIIYFCLNNRTQVCYHFFLACPLDYTIQWYFIKRLYWIINQNFGLSITILWRSIGTKMMNLMFSTIPILKALAVSSFSWSNIHYNKIVSIYWSLEDGFIKLFKPE